MITLCTFERDALFGQVWGDDVILSDVGEVIRDEWLRSSFLRPGQRVPLQLSQPHG